MSRSRLLLLTFALLFSLAACGGDDDTIAAGSDDETGASTDDGGAVVGDDTDGDDTDGEAGDETDDAAGSGAAGGGTTRPWIGGEWVLRALTVDGASVAIPPTAELQMTITGPGTISGDAGCNSFSGDFSAPFDGDRDAGSLSWNGLAITEMACDILDFELQYVDALLSANEWELAPPDGLIFRGDGVELNYGTGAPPAAINFEDSQWLFDTIFDGEGVERTASSTRADKPEVTLVVAGGVATLSSEDCGSIALTALDYTAGNEGPISFSGVEAAFEACEDPESNMLAAAQGLADATGFMVFDGRLTFIGLPGETVSFIATDG